MEVMAITVDIKNNKVSDGEFNFDCSDEVFQKLSSADKCVYKFDHLYARNHLDYCIVVESNRSLTELLEISVALEFLLEDLLGDSESLDNQCLLKVLCEYYECKDVKNTYLKYLPYMGYEEWSMITHYVFEECNIVQIDLFSARESCCGVKYKELYKHLPSGDELVSLKDLFSAEGRER